MKVFIAGDYCPRGRVEELIEEGEYSLVFDEVRSLATKADYSIVNFECAAVKDKAVPIEKSGPNLKCSAKGLDAIKYAGFKCVTLANNHFRDYGNKGVCDTLDLLESLGIDSVGGGRNLQEASKVFYKKIAGKSLAIINCCEHEFSIATEKDAGSNPLNPIRQYYAIQEAKNNADYVVVIVHGGHEHFQYPSLRMVETYRFFIDAGADAVVNHHQHCFGGYETYKGKPIFYGLGNFCFDNPQQHSGKWVEGYAVTINFTEGETRYTVHPYIQCSDEATIKLLSSDAFEGRLNEINGTITNPERLKAVVKDYYKKSSGSASWLFEPIRTGLFYVLRYKGLMPSLLSRKRKLDIANHILCESYLDKINWWLEN